MAEMQIQKVIEQLGYSSKEAKVYLAVLTLGESKISDIAEKVKLPRSSVEVIALKLKKDGLLNFYTMRRYKYWVAESPERLLSNIKRHEDLLVEAMPRLVTLKREGKMNRNSHDPTKGLELFRMLADTTSQPVLITNGDVEIVYVNAAWENQFGYELREVFGKNPNILKSGKTPKEVHQKMWQALNENRMFQSDEVIDKRKDGTLFNLLTTVFPVQHSGNIFFIQILDDITERKRTEKLSKQFLNSSE